ncbi:glycine zipper 2TM domain-containing protein [Rhodoferax sp.]|uniref:glycine zipper 2TM domain-containing protein n=1 Tax=Rhodoferax sp. TaxID=50421 RepID=UPI00271EF50C|nr:glycine zipper 2TM domain-containing protein [Rhodoferax sp.]MDO9195479.1 glycine zipper 2TM domain-containing protein [Rhodoferax sp.]
MIKRDRLSQLFLTLTGGLLLSGMTSTALAQTAMTPKAQYAAESKKALTRYEADKQLCNDETSSNARLQCRRDAKAEYDKAIAAAKAQMPVSAPAPAKAQAAKVVCADCGKVLAVTMHEKEGEGGPVGMIAGGVTGAILGRQVGGGLGKDLATIAGAAGGAYAGKKIEEKVRTHKVWTVSVQYGDGRKNSFEFEQDPGLKAGDPVKNSGNTIVRN